MENQAQVSLPQKQSSDIMKNLTVPYWFHIEKKMEEHFKKLSKEKK